MVLGLRLGEPNEVGQGMVKTKLPLEVKKKKKQDEKPKWDYLGQHIHHAEIELILLNYWYVALHYQPT